MRCIEARLRLEREKEQQETLILSVIPAHIGRVKNIRSFRLILFVLLCSIEYEIGNVKKSERNSEIS